MSTEPQDQNLEALSLEVDQLLEKIKSLESRTQETEKFCKRLIDALKQAEKDSNKFYLPEGTFFGITIE